MEDKFDDRAPGEDEEPSSTDEGEDETASRLRAERLRREIERHREGEQLPAPETESPRDFVERRRREIEGDETAETDSEH
jgi:hypothetical protein